MELPFLFFVERGLFGTLEGSLGLDKVATLLTLLFACGVSSVHFAHIEGFREGWQLPRPPSRPAKEKQGPVASASPRQSTNLGPPASLPAWAHQPAELSSRSSPPDSCEQTRSAQSAAAPSSHKTCEVRCVIIPFTGGAWWSKAMLGH